MTILHDTLRYLIRRAGAVDSGQLQELLLGVDADEAGFDDLAAYREHLAEVDAAQAEAQAEPEAEAASAPADASGTGTGAAGLSDDELAAELERRQAASAATT